MDLIYDAILEAGVGSRAGGRSFLDETSQEALSGLSTGSTIVRLDVEASV